MRAAEPIDHAGHAQLAVAPRQWDRRGRADLEPFGRPPQRPTVIDDTPGQPQSARLGQRDVSVGTRTSWWQNESGARGV